MKRKNNMQQAGPAVKKIKTLEQAYEQNDVTAFAKLISDPLVPLPGCNSTFDQYSSHTNLTFTFSPSGPVVTVDLDSPQKVEMWQAVRKQQNVYALHQKGTLNSTIKGHWDKLSRAFSGSTSSFRGSSRRFLMTSELTSVQNLGSIDDQTDFLMRREKPDFMRLQQLEQKWSITSLTLAFQGQVPYQRRVNALSHTVAREASSVDFKRGFPSNAVSTRLWMNNDSSRQNTATEIKNLGPVTRFVGESGVRDRAGGSSNGGKATLLAHKLKLTKRAERSQYCTTAYQSGKTGRVKINEDYRLLQHLGHVGSNEVLGCTATSRPYVKGKSNVADDISHVVLSESVYQGHRLGNFLSAIHSQIEIAQNKYSQRVVPIAYYDPATGLFSKLSPGGLALLVKLYVLSIRLPESAVDYDMELSDQVAHVFPGKTAMQFFTQDVSADETQQFLVSIIDVSYHANPYFQEVLTEGLMVDETGRQAYTPYVSSEFDPQLVRHYGQRFSMLQSAKKAPLSDAADEEVSRFARAAVAKGNATTSTSPMSVMARSLFTPTRTFKCPTPTPSGNSIIRQVPVLNKFRRYWDENNPRVLSELLHVLAHTLINRPYEDDPQDYRSVTPPGGSGDQLINYHPNHDVAFAIRKKVYLQLLIDSVTNEDVCRDQYQFSQFTVLPRVLQDFTPQERALLDLVVFLERCGRVNEKPGIDDPTNATRSFDLIKTVALDLGFSPDLVTSVCKNSRFGIARLSKEGFSGNGNRTRKAKVFLELQRLTHNCDLGRCRGTRSTPGSSKKFVCGLLYKGLRPFIPSANIKGVVEALWNDVEGIMDATGASMRDGSLSHSRNNKSVKKGRCLQDPYRVYGELIDTHCPRSSLASRQSVSRTVDARQSFFSSITRSCFREDGNPGSGLSQKR